MASAPSTTSTPRTTAKSKKRVRFHPRVTVQEIPHCWEMSPQELQSVWMDRRHLAEMRSCHDKDGEECVRGLEVLLDPHRIEQAGHLRQEKAQLLEYVHSLSHMSSSSTSSHMILAEIMATKYRLFSTESMVHAQLRGHQDALEAFAILGTM